MSRRPYVRPVSNTRWYLGNGRYRRYMLREVTCLLVGFYCFLAIWALAALATGSPDRWNAFLQTQQNAVMAAVHAVALIYYLIYMTFDWFQLAPKAMPLSEVSTSIVLPSRPCLSSLRTTLPIISSTEKISWSPCDQPSRTR